MEQSVKKIVSAHNLVLNEGKYLEITGVDDIDRFDDETVIMYTPLGELTVTGKNLHINRLDVGLGNITVEGEIKGMNYRNGTKQSQSFLGKIFK